MDPQQEPVPERVRQRRPNAGLEHKPVGRLRDVHACAHDADGAQVRQHAGAPRRANAAPRHAAQKFALREARRRRPAGSSTDPVTSAATSTDACGQVALARRRPTGTVVEPSPNPTAAPAPIATEGPLRRGRGGGSGARDDGGRWRRRRWRRWRRRFRGPGFGRRRRHQLDLQRQREPHGARQLTAVARSRGKRLLADGATLGVPPLEAAFQLSPRRDDAHQHPLGCLRHERAVAEAARDDRVECVSRRAAGGRAVLEPRRDLQRPRDGLVNQPEQRGNRHRGGRGRGGTFARLARPTSCANGFFFTTTRVARQLRTPGSACTACADAHEKDKNVRRGSDPRHRWLWLFGVDDLRARRRGGYRRGADGRRRRRHGRQRSWRRDRRRRRDRRHERDGGWRHGRLRPRWQRRYGHRRGAGRPLGRGGAGRRRQHGRHRRRSHAGGERLLRFSDRQRHQRRHDGGAVSDARPMRATSSAPSTRR